MNVKELRPYLPFILFASIIFAAVFIVEKINGRFWLNDFRVYYSAAQALVNHQQVYGIPFGLQTGFFKYSPFVAILFVPYTFFPFEVARTNGPAQPHNDSCGPGPWQWLAPPVLTIQLPKDLACTT